MVQGLGLRSQVRISLPTWYVFTRIQADLTATRTMRAETASAEVPTVPLTVEGYSVLHQMLRFRWSAWRQLRPAHKAAIAKEAAGLLGKMEQNASGQSTLYSLL